MNKCRNCKWLGECTCDSMEYADRLLFLDKNNFPIEKIKNRPIINFLRRLIHTCRVMKYETWRKKGGCKIKFTGNVKSYL